MATYGGIDRMRRDDKGLEQDYDQWPEHHYRGRGNDQSRTGPSGSWLQRDVGRFLRPPEARRPARGPRGYVRSDARIYEEVCEALGAHPDVDASEMEVTVERGEVTLRGMARSRFGKLFAEDLALGIDGVTDVVNELRIVNRGAPTSDTGRDQLYGASAFEGKR